MEGGYMRLFPILLISITALFGCSIQEINPDYRNMYVVDIQKDIIIIAPHANDPEASYPVYEIMIDANTEIESSKHKIDRLSINDDVKIWVNKIEDGKEIAEKVIVQD